MTGGLAAAPFRYAAFDLDGTLIDHDGRLDERICHGLRRLRASGMTLFVVTGRPLPTLVQLQPEFLDLFEPAILVRDGDLLWHRDRDSTDAIRDVPAAAVPALLAASITDFVVESGSRQFAWSRRAAARFGLLYELPRSSIAVGSDHELGPITKITVFDDPARIKAAAAAVSGCSVYTFRRLVGGTIGPHHTCKSAALHLLLRSRYHQQSLADVVAFGDGDNDACLLACAGAGVAVSDAHPLTAGNATLQLSGPLADYLVADFPRGLTASRPAVSCPHLARWEARP